MAFVHLHVHSQFTLLDGTFSPTQLVAAVKALGQGAVALTDRSNLYGAVEFFKAGKDAGIKTIVGAEIAVQPEGVGFQDPAGPAGGYNLVLLAEDEGGYRSLCTLITRAIFDGIYYRPRVDLDLLSRHHEGLLVLTSGIKGPIGRPVLRGVPDQAHQHLCRLLDIFGPDRLFLELQDAGLPGQSQVNEHVRALSAAHGVATVVTNAVHYLKPQDVVTQQLLHAIGTGRPLDGPNAIQPVTDQLYLKSEQEMRALFPHDGDALDRTAALAERCHFKYTFGKYHFPATTPPDEAADADTDANWAYFYRAFPPPRDFRESDDESHIPPRVPGAGNLQGYFGWYARTGLEHRLRLIPPEQHAQYRERLELEIRTISAMGFPAYLLIVAEFINWAKDHGIPVGPGRGSAAGSIAAWGMRITDVDPLRWILLFERFLNPERVSMPDIDVDFCQDRREEVIEHVRAKYGTELVSQIITYGKLQAKLALRDVARAAGLPFQDGDRIAKLVPNELNITLSKVLSDEDNPPLLRLMQADPKVRRIVMMAQRVEGLCRQTGVHAAGVVISDRPLVDYSPLFRDGPEGGPVVQYDMKSAESIGLIKFDFLGLKTLDQIRDAVKMVERNTGERIDISRIPLDDPVAFRLLQQGDALGVFQVESSGMRDLLVRLRPETLDEIIALIALYRPGPIQSGMVDDFIDRKHGRKPVEYDHPSLEPILRSTFGVILYQEQVMQVAQVLSGYSLGEADLLRRAMGKKKPEEMEKQKSRFMKGAAERGIDEAKADAIFDLLAKFAGYGFNKSHSAAYGIVAYQTAWLKAHYRAEYMAALLTIDAANTDKVITYINDCRRAGLEILPPDVNESQAPFDVPKGSRNRIRFGLAAVKAVGEAAVAAILEGRRKAGGRFKDLVHFLEHVDGSKVNKRVLENLIKCGAFDWTGVVRHALFDGLDSAMKAAAAAQELRASGQVSLFGGVLAAPPAFRPPDVAEWPTGQRLTFEKEALGFFISGHPLDAYGQDLKRHVTHTIDALHRCDHEAEVTVAGMITASRSIKTKRGDRMAFTTLEDRTGAVECVFFSEAWQASREAVTSGTPILVRGTVERRSDEPKITAESAERIADVLGRATQEVQVLLDQGDLAGERLEKFLEAMARHKGQCRARVHLKSVDNACVVLKLPPQWGLSADDALRDSLETLFRRPGLVRFL